MATNPYREAASVSQTPESPAMSQVLLDLQADLLKGRIEDTFEFAGRRFRMHTLSDGEALWRDQYVSVASNMALLSSRKSATVAAAVSHINDIPISEMFPLPEDKQLLGLVKNDSEERKSYYRERLYEFIQQFDDAIITEFFMFYGGLEGRRAEVIKGLKESSRETDSSISSSTSSAVVGPSSVEAAVAAPTIHGSSFAT